MDTSKEQVMDYVDENTGKAKEMTSAQAVRRMMLHNEPRNLPVVNPNPHADTPEERGCCVHPFPGRKQRRLMERNGRRNYTEGKLSAKTHGTGRMPTLQSERFAYEYREARRQDRINHGACPSCGFDAKLYRHDGCDPKHPTIKQASTAVYPPEHAVER